MNLTLIYKIILSAIFLIQSYSKLGGKNNALYAKWGIEGNMLITFGILELALAILIFTKFSHFTSLAMLAILGGAFMTIIKFHEPASRYVFPSIALITILLYSGKYWLDKIGILN